MLLKFDPLLKQVVPDVSKTQQIIEENEHELKEDALDTFKGLNDSIQNPFEGNEKVVLDVLDNSTSIHSETQKSPDIKELSNNVPTIPNNNKIVSSKNIEPVTTNQSSQSSVTETCNDKMSITYVNNHVMKDSNNIEDVLKSENIMRCVFHNHIRVCCNNVFVQINLFFYFQFHEQQKQQCTRKYRKYVWIGQEGQKRSVSYEIYI